MNKLKNLSWYEIAGLATVAIGLYYLIRRSFAIGGHFVEDTFITFRYAQHLTNGDGLTWNIGEPPAEGFTSLLHIILLSLGKTLGIPFSTDAVLLSILSLIVVVICFVWFHKRFLEQLPMPALVLLGIFLLDGRTAIHITAGMETVVFMALVALSQLATCLLIVAPSKKTAVSWAVIGLLSLWARPDAFFFLIAECGILFVVALLQYRRGDTVQLINTVLAYTVLLVIGLIYFAWKYHYYGYILPNTFYIKSGDLGLAGLDDIIVFFRLFFKYTGIPILLFLFAADFEKLKVWLSKLENRLILAVALLPSLVFLAYFSTTIHEVCYANRFEYPAYFGLLLFVSMILSAGFSAEILEHRISFVPAKVAKGLFCAMIIVLFAIETRTTAMFFPWSKIMNEQHYMPIGFALRKTGLKNDATLIFDSAGVVSYFSEFRHIDPVGLTDNYLSGREKLTAMQREKYLWNQQADVYIGPTPPASEGSNGDQNDPRLDTQYAKTILLGPITSGPYLRSYGKLSQQERSEALHYRMRELRDNWDLIREMPYPVADDGFTHYLYVRKNSKHHETLVKHIADIELSIAPRLP